MCGLSQKLQRKEELGGSPVVEHSPRKYRALVGILSSNKNMVKYDACI